MARDLWRPWRKASPEFLPYYVNRAAACEAVPRDFFLAGDRGTIYDLRIQRSIAEVVRLLYDRLCALGIEYDEEPVLLDDPASLEQRIRPPGEIVARKKGTCLDLAAFFAGLCIEAKLLPMLVLLAEPESAHALVIVDALKTYESFDDVRGWKEEDRIAGWLGGAGRRRQWHADGEFGKRLAEEKYLAVECTGFAKTVANGETLLLAFAEAEAKARARLAQADHVATFDIVRLQATKGYEPYVPPAAAEPGDLRERYVHAVRRTFCDFEFAGLSVDGATGRILRPEHAYLGMRFFRGRDTVGPAASSAIGLAELGSLRSAIVLGEAGAGKSGTLKLLVDGAARGSRMLTVYLPLRELTGVAITAAAIIDCIAEQAREQLGLPEITPAFLRTALEDGECLLAFDALDEVGDAATRQKTALALRSLADSYPKCRFFVTSRPYEYQETPIPEPRETPLKFEPFTLEPFGEQHIRSYLRTCFADDGALAEGILARSELVELAKGPLQLGLLAMVMQREQGELPEDQFGLFDTFVNTALETWEQLKGPDDKAPAPALRRRALERLAWAFAEKSGSAPLLEEDAYGLLAAMPEAMAISPAAMLDWLARRTGLIRVNVQRGRRARRTSYEFVHLQLAEFLAGCDLANRISVDFKKGFAAIREKLYDAALREVLRFAGAKLSQSGTQNRFLTAVLDADASYEDLLHRRVLLAGDLLIHCDFVDPAIEKRIVEGLCATAVRECCKAGQALSVLLQLPSIASARAILESIALAEGPGRMMLDTANKAPWAWDHDEFRAWAALAVCKSGGDEAPAILGRALAELTSPPMKAWLAQAWTLLGQRARARRELLAVLDSSESYRPAVLDEVVRQGFTEDAILVEQGRLATLAGVDKWHCAEWLWDHGGLDPDGAETLALFEQATRQLELRPAAYSLPDELNAAWQLALRMEEAGSPGGATQFIRLARVHPDIVWRDTWPRSDRGYDYGVKPREERRLDAAVAEALAAVARSDCDNSRRRVAVLRLVGSANKDDVVPLLLDLLRSDSALRWAGDELIAGLLDRGRAAEATAVLEGLAADVDIAAETRDRASQLLEKLHGDPDPEAFEKSLEPLDTAQAAARVAQLGRAVGGGPIIRDLLKSLATKPKGKAILEALVEPTGGDPRTLYPFAFSLILPSLTREEALRRVKQYIAEHKPDGHLIEMLSGPLGDHGMDDEAVKLLEDIDDSSWHLSFSLEYLAERGQRQRAVTWARRMLERNRLPLVKQLAVARLLLKWEQPLAGFAVPADLLEDPRRYIDESSHFDLGDLFAVLSSLDLAAAKRSFVRLLARGFEDPSITLDALEKVADTLPWQAEWSALLAEIAKGTGSPSERCRLLEELEKHV